MHLIALLLAAVFSSSFKAISNAEWTVNALEFTELTATLAAVTITPPTTHWFAEPIGTKVTFHFSTVAVEEPTLEDFEFSADALFKTEATQNGEDDYNAADVALTGLNLVGATKVFMYISYVEPEGVEGTDDKFDAHHEEFVVAAAPLQFAATGFPLAINLLEYPIKFVVTPNPVLAGPIDIKIDLGVDPESNEGAIIKKNVAKDDGLQTFTVSLTKGELMAAFPGIDAESTIEVFIAPVTEGNYYRTPKQLFVVDGPAFEVKTESPFAQDFITGFEIELEEIAAPASNAWSDISVVISRNHAIEKKADFDDSKDLKFEGLTATDGKSVKVTLTATVSKLTIAGETDLFIYVDKAATWETVGTPALFQVQDNPPAEAEFTIDPTQITDKTTIAKLTLTAKAEDAAWSATKVPVRLSFDNKEVLVQLDKVTPASSNAVSVYEKTDISLAALTTLANNSVITVQAAKSVPGQGEIVYMEGTAEITVKLPTPAEPTFTLDPTYVLFADVASIGPIEIVPSTAVTWGAGVQLKLAFTKAQQTKTVTLAVTQTGGKWKTGAAQSLNDLQLIEGDLPATVVAKVFDGTKDLTHTEEFKVLAEAPTDPVTFTIAPANMEFADTLTTPVITVTPSENAEWPTTAQDNLKAIFSYTGKTDISVKLAVSAAPHVYTIPATALTDFALTGAADAAITVKINDNTAVLEHTAIFTVKKKEVKDAAMGISPLVSLLAALFFLFVKLF